MYVGIREAKATLSRLLRKVREGVEVGITDRGKPVARFTRIQDEDLPLDQRVQALEQSGVLSPPAKQKRKLPPPLTVYAEVQAMLAEDRDHD